MTGEGMESSDRTSLENRPGIFVIGSSNVGKRTLLSRLLSVNFEDAPDSSSQLLVHGWTIDTKYYTADVSVWMAHLDDELSILTPPIPNRPAALVMVFDINNLSSFVALQDWVSRTDIQKFEILLCIGNKVDLLPDHPVHAEYRRRLQKHVEFSADPHLGFEFGISETEGSSLLGDEEPKWDTRNSCLDWCREHNIEYIEACASNADFDQCLSVDGDSQGVERLCGALSAHMWPGMILKTGKKMIEPSLPDEEEVSDEESDYEFEYEVLSGDPAEPWDGTHEEWVSASSTRIVKNIEGLDTPQSSVTGYGHDSGEKFDKDELQPSTSSAEFQGDKEMVSDVQHDKDTEHDEITPYDFEDLEQLMSEIGNVRSSLRLMPDFQRRERAAELAMKMAAMFGGGSDDEGEFV